MAYSVETLDGRSVAQVTGPLPSYADELVFDDVATYRVLGVQHRVVRGESHAVVLVERDDGDLTLGAARRRARRS